VILALTSSLAFALTLDEAVRRAAEVDPSAVVAELEWRQARLDATAAWASLGVTPSVSVSRTFAAGANSDATPVSVRLGVADPPGWFAAARESTQSKQARVVADATTLDAQYAAATLYYEVLAADAALEAAREGERFAKATADATAARVAAGLESELAGRSARLGLLQAEATTAGAEADLAIARARLGRALHQEVDAVAPTPPLELPQEPGRSPWIDAAAMDVDVARLERGEAIAQLFPTGVLNASSSLTSLGDWSLTLGLSWTLDGVLSPFAQVKRAAIEQTIADIELDATERDYALAALTAREQARAAGRVAEAARAREALANESLDVGQTRLSVGLASSLEVLRLQDEAAQARADRVSAELVEAASRLEARRVAGIAW
jgi:outer membrane protein TolC